MTSPSKRKARFGPAWWDRRGHVSVLDGLAVTTWGVGDTPDEARQWPRPCADCLTLSKASNG